MTIGATQTRVIKNNVQTARFARCRIKPITVHPGATCTHARATSLFNTATGAACVKASKPTLTASLGVTPSPAGCEVDIAPVAPHVVVTLLREIGSSEDFTSPLPLIMRMPMIQLRPRPRRLTCPSKHHTNAHTNAHELRTSQVQMR